MEWSSDAWRFSSGRSIVLKSIVASLAIGCLLTMVQPAPARADEPLASLAVMGVKAQGGVSKDQTAALSDLLAQEISRPGCYRVVTKGDVLELLQLEEQKITLGTCDDMSCLAEIGGALGVRWIVSGSVSRFGKSFLVNLKLIDVKKVQVASRVSRNVGQDQRALVPGVRALTRQLISEAKGLPKPVSWPKGFLDFSIKFETQEPGQPINPYPWIIFGSGLAVAAAGGVTGGLAWSEADRSEPFETVQAYDDWSAGVTDKSLAADVLMGVGGALVVSGVIWLIVDAVSDPDEAEAEAESEGDSPVVLSGSGLGAEVRF